MCLLVRITPLTLLNITRVCYSLLAEGIIGLAVTLLDTNDAEVKAPLPMDGDGDEFGGLVSKLSVVTSPSQAPSSNNKPGTHVMWSGSIGSFVSS